MGTKQYYSTFSLAHAKEEKAQTNQVSGQAEEANAILSVGAGHARVGVVCRSRGRDGETLGTGTMRAKYS